MGTMGPSCILNVLDFGIACDYACAAAWKNDTENRIHVTLGLMGLVLGIFDENINYVCGLSLGPLKELWFYNRPAFTKVWDKEFNETTWRDLIRGLFPIMFQSFAGQAHPPIKTFDRWWEKDYEDYVRVYEDPEIIEENRLLLPKVLALVPEKRARMEELKQKAKAMEEKRG